MRLQIVGVGAESFQPEAMTKYFIYCRKSSEDEERQVLSIEAQLTELREFAKQNSIFVVKEFYESKTAKEPGREVFNEMLGEIEKGTAQGILAWNPDRLARNSVDGGRVIYLVDTGKITTLKFPTFWFEPTPQGKFMLSVAFGQAKYYTDNLRENIWDVPLISVDAYGQYIAEVRDIFALFPHSSRVWHLDTRNLRAAALWCGVSASGDDNVPVASAPGVFGKRNVAQRRSAWHVRFLHAFFLTAIRSKRRHGTLAD